MSAVVAEGLKKHYGDTRALDGLDMEVAQGTVYGLLGPNGAGKTTAVKVMTTLVKPTDGRAWIDGIDVAENPRVVRTRIGLTGQYAAVEERLTGRENLELIGRYFHHAGTERSARAIELLAMFDLTEAGDRVANTYSGGMRRRLDIAMSLVARPSVLFLDEPTTGLDPRSRLAMWDFIERLGDEGTTVLLTTQYLEEADYLAEQIMVIDRGRKIAEGTSDQLKDQIGGDKVRVTIVKPENIQRAKEAIAPLCVGTVEQDPQSALTLTAPINAGGGVVPGIIRALDDAGVDVVDVEVRRPTLDDVFLVLTGHAAEAAGGDGEDG
ncbi:MAG: ATP-binding cassette domain-containing protein [Acidimicrobiales bacterium]|nr:ATP-binding cassette domain-containing protein [Acidimicrobiales bacterium]